ncbi:MAG: glycosyltransferase family 4 protein [Nitrospiraceae bacterium]
MDLWTVRSCIKRFRPDAVLLYYIGWIYGHHPMITFLPTVAKQAWPSCRVATMFAYPEGSGGNGMAVPTRVFRKVVATLCGESGADYEFGTLLRDSDAVLVMSDLHRPRFAEHFVGLDQKVTLVPPPPLLHMANGPSERIRLEGRAQLGVAADEFLFVYFGYIYPAKGLETILAALSVVLQSHPRTRLAVVGGDLVRPNDPRPHYAQEMKALGEKFGCGHAVRWTGGFPTESDEASRFLYSADAGLFGHDLGVAMNNSSFAALVAHHLPTVATRGAAVESPLRDGENVVFCAAQDPTAMANAMMRVMADAALRARVQVGTRALASEWFSWDGATTRILGVLDPGRTHLRCVGPASSAA